MRVNGEMPVKSRVALSYGMVGRLKKKKKRKEKGGKEGSVIFKASQPK